MLEMHFFFQGQQKCYEPGRGLFCTTRTWVWGTAFSSGTSHWYILLFSSAEWKTWICILLRIPSLFFPYQGFCHFGWPKGPNVIYDSCPTHVSSSPYFDVQNGWNSPEHCDTSAQFTFVSFIKHPPQKKLHFYSPAKPGRAHRRCPGVQPRVLKSSDRIWKKVLRRHFLQQNKEGNTFISRLTSVCRLRWGDRFLRPDLFSPLPSSPAAVGDLARKMLGFHLTTKQTSEEGVKVNTVSQSIDRRHRLVLIFSHLSAVKLLWWLILQIYPGNK